MLILVTRSTDLCSWLAEVKFILELSRNLNWSNLMFVTPKAFETNTCRPCIYLPWRGNAIVSLQQNITISAIAQTNICHVTSLCFGSMFVPHSPSHLQNLFGNVIKTRKSHNWLKQSWIRFYFLFLTMNLFTKCVRKFVLIFSFFFALWKELNRTMYPNWLKVINENRFTLLRHSWATSLLVQPTFLRNFCFQNVYRFRNH